MNTPLQVTFGFDRKLFQRAIMAFWFSAVPRASLRFRLIFWIVVWLLVLAGVIVVGALQLSAAQAWAIAAAIVAVWIIVLQRVRMARFYRALGRHWDKNGQMSITFDASGLVVTQQGSRLEFSWEAVDAMVRTRGGTVFRIGMTMLAVPDASLPDGLSPKAFRDELRKWMPAG